MSFSRKLLLVAASCCFFCISGLANAQVANLGTGYYRLTNAWQGDTKSLDVVNDGVSQSA
jgi:hypothetical protein